MDEGKINRLVGAIHGMAVVLPHAAAELHSAINLRRHTGERSLMTGLSPLERTAYALMIGGENQDVVRYLAAEACAITRPDDASVRACVTFADELHRLILDGEADATRLGPLDVPSCNDIARRGHAALMAGLSAEDFSDVTTMPENLIGAVALVAGAKLGILSVLKTTGREPDAFLFAEIDRHRHDRAPGLAVG